MSYRIQLFPDEPLAGYRGHICFHLDLSGAEETTAALNAGFGLGARRALLHEKPFIQLASEITGQSVYDLVRLHSMWFLVASTRRETDPPKVEAWMLSQFGRTDLFRRTRAFVWSCPECQSEDLDFWGESFWRRAHQIPGQIKCPKHGVPLACCNRGFIEHGAPDHWDTQVPDWVKSKHVLAHERIDSFTEACGAILDGGLTLDPLSCSQRIRKRAADLWPNRSVDGRIHSVLDRVAELYPRAWLADLDRRYVNIKGGQFGASSTFLRGTNLKIAPQLLMLLAMAVFDSTDEMLSAMVRPCTDTLTA